MSRPVPARAGLARGPGILVLAALAGGLVAAAVRAAPLPSVTASQEARFPHARHAGLFPVCTGCHASAAGGEPGYPDPSLCARCHDGRELREVSWRGPAPVPSNLAFGHAAHSGALAEAGRPVQSCEACHAASGTDRMSIGRRAEVTACFSCHEGTAEGHLAGGPACQACHVPLADAELDVGWIAGLPVPEDHRSGAFVPEAHEGAASGDAARCATCHTVERCLACHVNEDEPVLARIPAARPDQELPPAVAGYPVPRSHREEGWLDRHGGAAELRACDTCHTSDDCLSCHVGRVPEIVERLPARADVRAPGAGVRRAPPPSHRSPFFLQAHRTLAAADDGGCTTCHTEAACVGCHDAASGGSYHPSDFTLTHSADAFGREDECATCHDTAVFCRSCHVESGLGSSGRLGAGYHDAEPLWLLRHGGAARQSLESCASCHQQRDCVQCHGVLGSFGVNPHRDGFDARAARSAAPATCLACHLGDPLGAG